MPTSLEQLDLLLSTVAKPRKIHTDGIHFLNLRYIDPVLADYEAEHATIRYDPRDITEIRVYLRTLDGETFLCRAICPELSGETVSLKEITAARNARRKQLRGTLTSRSAVVDRLLAAHSEPLPAAYPTTAPAELSNWTTPDETTTGDPGHDRPRSSLNPEQTARPGLDQADPTPTLGHTPRLKRYWNQRPRPATRARRANPCREWRYPTRTCADHGDQEHKRFLEFADAVRRKRYVGLCFGAPGVGKTESARTYAKWDQLAPHLAGVRATGSDAGDADVYDVLSARAVMYTPKVHSTPQNLDKEISYLCDRLGWTVELMLQTGRGSGDRPGPGGTPSSTGHAELLIVDEADRLKTAALEQLRDHHDRTGIGLILIGMPGIEKRLARYPQLYSRVGFVHHHKPLSADEQAFVLARHWPHLGLGNSDDFATTEAIAAITRITNGNFRLTTRLVDQVERVLEINQLSTVTKEVVEAARENLVIGIM